MLMLSEVSVPMEDAVLEATIERRVPAPLAADTGAPEDTADDDMFE